MYALASLRLMVRRALRLHPYRGSRSGSSKASVG
jgi:hypothetical protein